MSDHDICRGCGEDYDNCACQTASTLPSKFMFSHQQYQVIESEQLRMWDIDDTLVMHSTPCDTTVTIVDPVEGGTIELGINEPMVRLLKEEHSRGSFNIVWSRGGYAWAQAVITALGLADKVHLIMSKPLVYFDDSPVEHWLKDRVYLAPNVKYKK